MRKSKRLGDWREFAPMRRGEKRFEHVRMFRHREISKNSAAIIVQHYQHKRRVHVRCKLKTIQIMQRADIAHKRDDRLPRRKRVANRGCKKSVNSAGAAIGSRLPTRRRMQRKKISVANWHARSIKKSSVIQLPARRSGIGDCGGFNQRTLLLQGLARGTRCARKRALPTNVWPKPRPRFKNNRRAI